MPRINRSAFTIVEMLVVVAIITLLVGILLPAISSARDQAKVTQSESNLRNLGTAHANYASEWNDRQFTLAVDDIAAYGIRDPENPNGCVTGPPGPVAAIAGYECRKQSQNRLPDGTLRGDRESYEYPAIELGWGFRAVDGQLEKWFWKTRFTPNFPKNYSLIAPISFRGPWGNRSLDVDRFGYFRMPNARQFNQYVSGRFFDPVFYAPKDTAAIDMAGELFDAPEEYTSPQLMRERADWGDNDFCYSSYSLSPAALFSPQVLAHNDPDDDQYNGFQNPWELPGGLRAPAMSQLLYPSLKTHMLEHHWLQRSRGLCNPAVTEASMRPYRDCQPYFFNQGVDSKPATLFYDGHVELVGVRDQERADGRHQVQAGWGLWSRDTPFGEDGYFIGNSYGASASTSDTSAPDGDGDSLTTGGQRPVAQTSFHIFTTDGVRGRDITD